jgi:DNA-binding MarR family transcriptional regulator
MKEGESMDVGLRTLNDILRYIQIKNVDGRLQESLSTIAKRTGYSHVTIHRGLKQLEEQGLIRVIQAPSQNLPNTIEYLGDKEHPVANLLKEAEMAIDLLDKATQNMNDVLYRLRETVSDMQQYS